MKPTFALDLRHDTITLLHRAGPDWHVIRATEFGAPDMNEALAQMRVTALDLSPQGIATKLILPNDQILYTQVTAAGPSPSARRAQIRDALAGRTPYDVDDLVFDWAEVDGTDQVNVAVIARETLDQAEGFVASHGLNPVGFAAVPDGPGFAREPWFGASSIVATILPAGTKVEGDRTPLRMAGSVVSPPAEKVAPIAEAEPEILETEPEAMAQPPEPQPVEPQPVEPQPVDPQPVDPQPVESPSVDLSFAIQPSAYTDEPPFPAAQALAQVEIEQSVAAPIAPTEAPDQPETIQPEPIQLEPIQPGPIQSVPSWLAEHVAATAMATRPAPAAPLVGDAGNFIPPKRDPASSASRRWFEDAEEAPMAVDVDSDPQGAVLDDRPPARDAATAPAVTSTPSVNTPSIMIDDDMAPPVKTPPLETFASRRAPRIDGGPPAAPTPILSGAARPTPPPAPRPAATNPAAKPAKGLKGLITAPGIAGLRKAKPVETKRIVTIKPEPKAGQKPADTGFVAGRIGRRERGRPAYLLLILTVALLIAMALVAAWSTYIALHGTKPAGETAIAAVEPGTQTPALSAPAPVAAPEPAPVEAPVAAPESAPEVALADAPTETPLPEGSAGPAPSSPAAAAPGAIVLSSQDAPAILPDKVVEPVFAALAAGPPPIPDVPPAFGTVLEFDATGLIKPTPKGIETPEGVFLLAGKPPVIPPRRSALAEAAALAAAASAPGAAAPTALVAPDGAAPAAGNPPAINPPVADPTLANARPKPRPATLAPPTLDDTGLAAPLGQPVQTVLRPRLRPASVLAAGEAARPAAATPGATASLAAGAVAEGGLIAPAPSVQVSALTVTISRVPVARPRDLERAVDAAVAAALAPNAPSAPEPEAAAPEVETAAAQPAPPEPAAGTSKKPVIGRAGDADLIEEEPEVASSAPSAGTSGTVAKNATFRNAIDLGETNLIGIYGTENRRYAMVRTSNGSYKKVKVGDRVDGAKVAAITTKELRLQKNGNLKVLKIPGG